MDLKLWVIRASPPEHLRVARSSPIGNEVGTKQVNESPGKGRGHNRDGLYHQPIPVEPTNRFRTRSFSPERQTVFGEPTRLVSRVFGSEPPVSGEFLFSGVPSVAPTGCEVAVSASEVAVSSSELTERSSESAIGAVERSADLSSEAAETLRSASGGGPAASGEAAVTRDRRDRERHAVRSRGGRGRGAESAGWREVAAWCDATEGSDHE
jgi:hypothetical protein